MASTTTIVGQSGRTYVQGDVLQRRQDPRLSIFKAQSGDEPFVFKRVPRHFFELSQRLGAEFAGSRGLRIHVDSNEEEYILIYPYFNGTLLSLIKEDPELSFAGRKKILRSVGEAIQELHDKNWLHIDVKPDNVLVNWTEDNVLVNWTEDEEGKRAIGHVALGDFDIAFKSEHGEPRVTPCAIGNVMWRSPEGQTGRGVTKASDIYSFGLVCLYAFGGGDLLILSNESFDELKRHGVSPEQEILCRHVSYFGPVPEGLLKQVDSPVWSNLLEEASAMGELAAKEQPQQRFEVWGQELGPTVYEMLSSMLNLDPTARATIGQILAHPWWQEAAE